MIKYKADILKRLKDVGYNSVRIRQEKILGESAMSEIRHAAKFPNKTLDKLCKLLDCQVGDILEYVPDEETEEKK